MERFVRYVQVIASVSHIMHVCFERSVVPVNVAPLRVGVRRV